MKGLVVWLAAPLFAIATFPTLAAGQTKDKPASAKQVSARPALAEPRDLSAELPIVAGGLTADQAAERAVKVVPSIERADATQVNASRKATLAIAGFAPRVDLRGSYSRLSPIDQVPLVFGGMEIANPFPIILDQYLLRLSASIPVTDYFLTVLPTYRGVKESAVVAALQAQAEHAAVALRAKEAYYDYARARGALLVAEDSVRLLTLYLPDLEALVAGGLSTKADLLQTRAQLAQATTNRLEAEGMVRVAEATLRQMLRLDPKEPIHLGEGVLNPVSMPVPVENDVLAKAMSQRPELKALRGMVWANESIVTARRGARWPQLSIVGNLDYANPNQRAIPQTRSFSTSWSAGVLLTWSPNDFVAADVRLDDARLDLVRAQTDLAALENQIVVEVSRAVTSFRTAKESVRASAEGVASAVAGLRVRKDLLDAGEATSNELLQAEAALRNAQLTSITALIATRVARAHLVHVVGDDVLGAQPSETRP